MKLQDSFPEHQWNNVIDITDIINKEKHCIEYLYEQFLKLKL